MSETNKNTSGSCLRCFGCPDCSNFELKVLPVINSLDLSVEKKKILKKRFIKEVMYYEDKSKKSTKKYNFCRIIIAIGSMMLPTLQTIQGSENVKSVDTEIYWAAIGTSLSVMIANSFISIFHLDKNFYLYHLTSEKLKALGWKYFELSGEYAHKSHEENWVKFWNDIEKPKLLQISNEFSGNEDHKNDDAMVSDIMSKKKETDDSLKSNNLEEKDDEYYSKKMENIVLKQLNKLNKTELFKQSIVDNSKKIKKTKEKLIEDSTPSDSSSPQITDSSPEVELVKIDIKPDDADNSKK